MAERTVRAGVDSYVAQASPGQNRNGMNVALVQNGTSGNTNRMFSYLKAPAPVEAGVSIISAKLRYYVRSASQANVTLTARAVDSSWKAAKITWNNQPDVASSGIIAIGADANASAGEFVEFDVTHVMQAVSDGAKWYGWRIVSAESGQWVTLSTAEAKRQNRRPELTVEYSNAPAASVDLSPSGGWFISTGAPVLRYTYLDYGGNRELTFQQIQVENLATTVNYDTGMVAASEPEYDLDDGVFVPLANGENARWRVKVWDGAGKESPWSDWAHFERLTKGTLTINNPSAAPSNFVQEVTPPITWTHGGSWAQVAYQVIIQQKNLAGNWMKIFDSRKRSGNDDSLTLPKGVLTRANWSSDPGGSGWQIQTEYRVVVRTWDGQGRQHTPGDPVYYQDARQFDVREGTTAKVTNLAVEQLTAYPFVQITWTRATAPDKFIIARGGDVIDEVTPDQVDQGDGTYRYLDTTATLNRAHTWAILPVVNGQMAPIESTHVTKTIEVDGIWLLDPDEPFNSAVLVMGLGGDADLSMSAEDDAEVLKVVGRSAPVRITRSVGLPDGSVSGVVADHPHIPNVSKLEWRNRLRDLKDQPGKRLRLLANDYNMPVVIGDVVDGPNPVKPVIDVTFNFWRDDSPSWV